MDLAAVLADPARPLLPGPAALVVAHPDDEAIGFGGQFARTSGLVVVHLTDGAPERMDDARRLGFSSRDAYAAARSAERDAVLDLAGVAKDRRIALGLVDQTVADRLVEVTRALLDLFRSRNIRLVFTHACEGGHPDHDAAAFAVATACRMLGPQAPAVVEMPFYHLGPDGTMVVQRFANPPDGPALPLPAEVVERKRAMFDAHRSQAAILALFDPMVERVRLAPERDFSEPPNGGRLFYPEIGSTLDASGWTARARDAERALLGP